MKAGLRFDAIPYHVRLRTPVVTAAGAIEERRGFWIRLVDEEGRTGYGEASPLPGFSDESYEDIVRSVRRLSENQTVLRDLPATPPSVHASIELALLDIRGQQDGRAIAELLSERPRARVRLNALLTAIEPDEIAAEASDAVAAGYGTLKVKVGALDPAKDAERLAAVRTAVGKEIALRADANGAYDVVQAIQALRLFEPYGLEYVEQPVPRDLAPVHRHAAVPIAADESAATPAMARLLIQERAVNVLILKPMILGGPIVAARVVQEAQAAGIAVVITSAFDTPIGLAGSLHLSAAIPGAERACGLATAGLLEPTPIAGFPEPRDGCLAVPQGPGLGVDFEEGSWKA